MESFRANNKMTGYEWDAKVDVNPKSILNNDNYNGRINIIEDDNPDVRFEMFEKIAIKNKATEYRGAITSVEEETLLSNVFFSQGNVQILQNGIRAGVYNTSNNKIVVPPQDIDVLKTIMRSIYLQYAKHTKDMNITKEIEKLNHYVLEYCVKNVYSAAEGYLKYCRDQSTLVSPLERPLQVDRDYKHLEIKNWT